MWRKTIIEVEVQLWSHVCCFLLSEESINFDSPPGGSLSGSREFPLVFQQQRIRGVEGSWRIQPDRSQVRAPISSQDFKGLRDAVLHRGERDRKAGGGLCLPGETWSFDSFADLSLQIVPTGKPSPLTGCQIVNKTLTSLKVQCQEGKPGPKEEMFTFFHENISKALTAAFPPTSCLSSTTLRRWSSSPKWPTKCQYLRCHWNCQQYWSSWSKLIVISSKVSHIDPGVPIKLLLYAENAKGTSDPAVIDDALSSQHKHYVEGGEMMTEWLWRWWLWRWWLWR